MIWFSKVWSCHDKMYTYKQRAKYNVDNKMTTMPLIFSSCVNSYGKTAFVEWNFCRYTTHIYEKPQLFSYKTMKLMYTIGSYKYAHVHITCVY